MVSLSRASRCPGSAWFGRGARLLSCYMDVLEELSVEQRRSNRKWLVLVLLVLGAAMLNYSNMIFASRPVDVMAQFNMSQAQLTAISGLGVLPGALFSIVLGNYFDKRGNKTMCFVGTALIVLAAACQLWRVYASSYAVLFIITFLSGTFFLPTQVLPAKVIAAWFNRKEMGVAMGIYGSAAGVGIMLAFIIGGLLDTTAAALMSCFLGYAVVAVMWFFLGRMPDEHPLAKPLAERAADAAVAEDAPAVSVKAVIKSKSMWYVMICGGLAAGAPLLFNTYVVNAFLAKGMDVGLTSLLAVTFNISLVLGAIISGIIVAKTGRYNRVYGIFAVVSGFALLGTYLVPVGVLSFVLLATGGFFGASSMAVNLARIGLLPLTGDFGPENIGIAGGMNNTAMGVCMFVLPTIAAALLNDNYLGVFITVCMFFLIMALVGGILCPELGEKGKLVQAARESE